VKTSSLLAGPAIVAGVALSLLIAAPASAAPGALVAGSELYALDCDDASGQIYLVDAMTGDATALGDATGARENSCAGQAAWDRTTQTAYYLHWSEVGSELATIDGFSTTTVIGEFLFEEETVDVDSIAIGIDGAAYAIDDDDLYALDLATAELTDRVALIPDLGGLYSFAVDPSTGVFYAMQENGLIYEVDVATGALTEVGQFDLDGSDVYSLQIDVDGTFWVENDRYDEDLRQYESQLWSFDPTDIAETSILSGPIATEDGIFYTESLLLAYSEEAEEEVPAPVTPVTPAGTGAVAPVAAAPAAPELAATGAEQSLLLAAVGAGLAFGGGALVMAQRRRSSIR